MDVHPRHNLPPRREQFSDHRQQPTLSAASNISKILDKSVL
jgi:hypothetical protein